eukprot:1188166-Prorocentrum_minimum.AAC.2
MHWEGGSRSLPHVGFSAEDIVNAIFLEVEENNKTNNSAECMTFEAPSGNLTLPMVFGNAPCVLRKRAVAIALNVCAEPISGESECCKLKRVERTCEN